MTDHERGVEAAARAMCEAWHYAKIGTPDGDAEWKRKQAQYRKQAEAAISAYLSALAPQAGDNAEEPVAWQFRHMSAADEWTTWRDCSQPRYINREQDAAFRNGRVEFRPLYLHPCTSTPVVSQNAPDLEDKGGDGNTPSPTPHVRDAADAYVAEQGVEYSGGIIERAFEAGARWATLRSLPEGFRRQEIEDMLSIVQDEPQTVDGGGEYGPQESTDGWYTRLLRAILNKSDGA
ncbi:hypothetical protein [Rhizobium hidalgonense]|uniref:hypothetical protein n=1 Tax=Rhizobium hidalgonense TaxID=1538159 RepID=UPI002870B6BE|nr:hypothetical protein [Rhizobium hidalgonense]MDR9813059.1 hypothetical protein [Rhizobium hidalgonense]